MTAAGIIGGHCFSEIITPVSFERFERFEKFERFVQQVSATAHTTSNSVHCSNSAFGYRRIIRGLWPPYSQDLNP